MINQEELQRAITMLTETVDGLEIAEQSPIIGVLGRTQVGKSSFINAMLGNTLSVVRYGAYSTKLSSNNIIRAPEIGSGTRAKTVNPSVYSSDLVQYGLLDTAGYLDTRGETYRLNAQFGTQLAIKKSRDLQGIIFLTTNPGDIGPLCDDLNELVKLFTNLDAMRNNVLLVVNKSRETVAEIREQLRDVMEEAEEHGDQQTRVSVLRMLLANEHSVQVINHIKQNQSIESTLLDNEYLTTLRERINTHFVQPIPHEDFKQKKLSLPDSYTKLFHQIHQLGSTFILDIERTTETFGSAFNALSAHHENYIQKKNRLITLRNNLASFQERLENLDTTYQASQADLTAQREALPGDIENARQEEELAAIERLISLHNQATQDEQASYDRNKERFQQNAQVRISALGTEIERLCQRLADKESQKSLAVENATQARQSLQNVEQTFINQRSALLQDKENQRLQIQEKLRSIELNTHSDLTADITEINALKVALQQEELLLAEKEQEKTTLSIEVAQLERDLTYVDVPGQVTTEINTTNQSVSLQSQESIGRVQVTLNSADNFRIRNQPPKIDGKEASIQFDAIYLWFSFLDKGKQIEIPLQSGMIAGSVTLIPQTQRCYLSGTYDKKTQLGELTDRVQAIRRRCENYRESLNNKEESLSRKKTNLATLCQRNLTSLRERMSERETLLEQQKTADRERIQSDLARYESQELTANQSIEELEQCIQTIRTEQRNLELDERHLQELEDSHINETGRLLRLHNQAVENKKQQIQEKYEQKRQQKENRIEEDKKENDREHQESRETLNVQKTACEEELRQAIELKREVAERLRLSLQGLREPKRRLQQLVRQYHEKNYSRTFKQFLKLARILYDQIDTSYQEFTVTLEEFQPRFEDILLSDINQKIDSTDTLQREIELEISSNRYGFHSNSTNRPQAANDVPEDTRNSEENQSLQAFN